MRSSLPSIIFQGLYVKLRECNPNHQVICIQHIGQLHPFATRNPDFTTCVFAEMVKWSNVWNPSANTPRKHWDDHDINHPSPAHVLDFFDREMMTGNLSHYVTTPFADSRKCLSLCWGSSSSKKGFLEDDSYIRTPQGVRVCFNATSILLNTIVRSVINY